MGDKRDFFRAKIKIGTVVFALNSRDEDTKDSIECFEAEKGKVELLQEILRSMVSKGIKRFFVGDRCCSVVHIWCCCYLDVQAAFDEEI
jgi:hypothetical protein